MGPLLQDVVMDSLPTVLAVACADKGRSSPRKSAAFRNGYRAAILAVRENHVLLVTDDVEHVDVGILEVGDAHRFLRIRCGGQVRNFSKACD